MYGIYIPTAMIKYSVRLRISFQTQITRSVRLVGLFKQITCRILRYILMKFIIEFYLIVNYLLCMESIFQYLTEAITFHS